MLLPLFNEERHVDALPSQEEVPVSIKTAALLVERGGYDRDDGLLPGIHFRKRRGTGCYHLRVKGRAAFLHRDLWDPRRFPLRHFFETPALVLPVLAVAVGFLVVRKK